MAAYRPPSIVSVATELSSPTEDKNASKGSRLSGFFGRKKKDSPKKEVLESLPNTLSFAFSSAGQNLVLWRKNGHSLIHIKIASWESKMLPLRHALPTQDPDRGVNIKLVAEGDGWISAIIYHKRV
jgi:hypothetical protein